MSRFCAVILATVMACSRDTVDATVPRVSACNTVGAATGRVPLTELLDHTYLGFTGGLYPGCSNELSGAHDSAGRARARQVQPLDANGNPSASGRIALLSIGMSNTTQEFCSFNALQPCDAWTFVGQAAADPSVNHTTLVLVNGARGGQSADIWVNDTSFNYNLIRDLWLKPNGLTERQVQVAWVKVANPNPTVSLPSANADAYGLEQEMGTIVRVLKHHYPNLRQVFFSSRIYGGYGLGLNPEPEAYESGFAVKWLIEAQIRQMEAHGAIQDSHAGDLNLDTGAPWLGWGAYLWANGTTARADGLVWNRSDIESDGVHPSQSGEQKVGALLLTFFKTSPYSACWFLAAGGAC